MSGRLWRRQIFLGLRQLAGIDLGQLSSAPDAGLLARIEEMRRGWIGDC